MFVNFIQSEINDANFIESISYYLITTNNYKLLKVNSY